MLMDPHPSQQHAGLHHAVWQLQQEVTRLKARFKPTSPKKSGVDGGANQVPTYLGQLLHLYSPWWSSLAIITSSHCISGVCPMMQHPVQPYKGLRRLNELLVCHSSSSKIFWISLFCESKKIKNLNDDVNNKRLRQDAFDGSSRFSVRQICSKIPNLFENGKRKTIRKKDILIELIRK